MALQTNLIDKDGDLLDIGSDGIMSVKLPDSIDITSNAMRTVTETDAATHRGKHFKAGFQDLAMSTGDVIELVLVTPNTTEWAHFSLRSSYTGIVTVDMFEGATLSDDGTAVTRLNRNRNSDIVSTTLAYHTPSITTTGTKIVSKFLGSEGFRSDIGESFAGSDHFLLKQNTKYILRLTAVTNNIKCSIGGDWLEIINK